MSSNELKAAPPESELLRALVDNVSAILAYWDATLHCAFANRAFERWYGVSPEDLIGKHISDVLGPRLYELSRPHIEGALRGIPQEFERTIPDPGGGPPRESLTSYYPNIVDGVVRGFFVMVTDISEIKRAELALRESQERFRLTIDEAPIGMALVAPDGRFIRVNRVFCEIVGYAPDELLERSFPEITHPEDLDVDLELAGRLARGEIPRYKLAKRYIRKDRTIVDVMLSASMVRGVDGAPLYYVSQVEDITEQKRLEAEQRFLAEIGPSLATTLDYEETLTTVAELAARHIADLCIVELVEDGEEVRRFKVASRDPSKAPLCDCLTRVPLERHHSDPTRAVLETKRPVLVPRISEKTLASYAHDEEQLRALRAAELRSLVAVPLVTNARLLGAITLLSSAGSRPYGPADIALVEELARRAALSIENARLYRSALRATQMRDDVLGIVAHDLRNPLNSILMQAGILQLGASEPGDRARQGASKIESAAKRMYRLIQDLLDMTLMEAGKLSIDPARLAAPPIVAEALEAQRALATSAALELRLELSPDLPEVWADRDRLLQVFENLIGNALKFTSPGGWITIGAIPRDDEVLFSVTDTGTGIAPEDAPHVFDRFWRARKSKRHGAGLGLPIVKGIIEAHGGRVWLETTPGKGSTFLFTIPTAHRVPRPTASAWNGP